MSNLPNDNRTPQPVRGLAVYIHWPFCKSKCPYCDFNSHVRESVDQERWKKALLAELDYMASHVPNRTVTSIFFGGGTPSLMPPATAAALIDRVHALWKVNDIEITFEANPTSVEANTFKDFKKAGINRVSLGVQSLNADDLTFLGRHHSVDEALKAVDLAKNTFPRYSFDLIYARPNQTLAAWEKELRQALDHADGHLSLYQLTIEQNTAFYTSHNKGEFTIPGEIDAEALYRLTEDIMSAHNLPAYEVSNYAKPGEESRHNVSYWRGDDYIGVGPGAHGRITDDGLRMTDNKNISSPSVIRNPSSATLRVATQTLKSPERWLEQVTRQNHGVEIWQELTPRQEIEERVMMGLRLKTGIDYQQFKSQTDIELLPELNTAKLNAYIKQGLLASDGKSLRTTLSGRLVLNTLTAELLA